MESNQFTPTKASEQPNQNQPKGSKSPKSTAVIVGILLGIAAVLLMVYAVVKNDTPVDKWNQNVGITNTNQPEVITSSVDTSDWKTYRNDELGLEFKYPDEMLIREDDEVNPVSGIRGNPNVIAGCYYSTIESGQKVCKGFGGFSFELKKDVKVKDGFEGSLEGFEALYQKSKEVRASLGIGLPRLLELKLISSGNKWLYQAKYFGGDSFAVHVYIPHQDGLLIYSYDIAPIENDTDTKYHEEVAKAILLSLKLNEYDDEFENWLSVPESTIHWIKQYLATNHGFDRNIENTLIRVVEISGDRIYGEIASRGKPTGAEFLAENKNESLRMIFVGQDALPCNEVVPYGFSAENINVCWDSTNNSLKQRR